MAPKLHIVIGPMFAGKTTYLINKVNELLSIGVSLNEILLINHSSDTRYANSHIHSHNGQKIESQAFSKLSLLNKNNTNMCSFVANKKYILIDESQFFYDLYPSITKLLCESSSSSIIEIYIFGLDGDFKQEPFRDSRLLELIPFCSSITKLQAKCACGMPAPMTKRITQSQAQILVGGSNDYHPVCLEHL
jgi:thymidine kinase